MRVKIYTDSEPLELSDIVVNDGNSELERIDAIKLRNLLNTFINGELEDEEV